MNKLKINNSGGNDGVPKRKVSKLLDEATKRTNDDDNNDMKKWRTDPVDNKNILNKIGGDLENSMSSMSGSEDEEAKQQEMYDLMKKKSSKKSDENYDVKSSKMAMSESAKSRRS